MGRNELVLKISCPDESERLSDSKNKNHKRESSNTSSAKISTSSTSSSPKRKESIVLVKFSRKNNNNNNDDEIRTAESLSASEEKVHYTDCDRLPKLDLQEPTNAGMLSSSFEGSKAAYGSFQNTPTTSPMPTGEGEDRRDSGGALGNSASYQPLLHNPSSGDGGSSSDDDVGGDGRLGYVRRKSRRPGSVSIDIEAGEDQVETAVTDAVSTDISGSDPLKTLIAFAFLVVAWIATTTSLALTHERVPDDNPLPDFILDNVAYQTWGLETSEIVIIVSTWIAFLVVLFHKYRFVVFRRLFFLVGIHYYYRAVTMYVTVLPKADPHYQCAPKLNETSALEIAQRVLRLLSGMGLSINGQHIYCGDYIYSGHAMTLIMTYLTIKHYASNRLRILKAVSFVLTVAGIVFLLLGRGHYTIDVLIAYFITTRLWWIYHTLAENAAYRELDERNYLGNSWWFLIFRYFESNVQSSPLPNEYNLPIPDKWLARWNRRRHQPESPSLSN